MSGTTVSRSALHARTQRKQRSQLRIGSLFSGYGGLDLAVEHVFNARTVWFSELNEPVARVFARHWPDAPNLGDITTIDWSLVEPVDILIGGFPCQDVSTVGKRAGLAPGTRSGLWAHMAEAIDALQPEWVVIENVRGLLSSPATRHATKGDDHEQRNPGDATPDDATLRGLEPTRGIWETTQLDLYGLWAPFSGIWPTCGWMRDGSAYRLPLSALLTNASASSPSPGALFRTPLASDSSRGGETLDQVRARRGTIALSDTPDHRLRTSRTGWLAEQASRIGDAVVADRRTVRRWGRYADAIARWEHITGRPAPAPTLLNDANGPRPAPAFVEWLMGLPAGWATGTDDLTPNQQITALGNGVLPLQAAQALDLLGARSGSVRSLHGR